jgi:methionine-rich copper-binding protein CopC
MTTRHAALLLAASLTLALPAPVLAHTHVISSSPREGARLARVPAVIAVTFGDPIGRLGTMTVTRNGAGDLVRSARIAPRDRSTALIFIKRPGPRKRAGTYRLVWRVTGADGHRVAGTIAFRVRP